MTTWLLVMFLNGDPHIIDYYDSQQECEQAIIAQWECVEGTIVKNGLNEWDLKELRND